MTLGFGDRARLRKLRDELTTWELYQVTVDKYHVMFWFQSEHALINAAWRFETVSADGKSWRTYDVQAEGDRKLLDVDHLLRRRIVEVDAFDERQLTLAFEGGGQLVLHDDPNSRSCWFYRYDPEDHNAPLLWFVEDDDGDR